MIKLGTTEKLLIYLLYRKECTSTKEIIKLLAKIRKTESAVRASLFRLRKKRFIKDLHEGRESFFSLAVSGMELVQDYTSRLDRAEEMWNSKWLLFSFNVPEKKRALRNKLRHELIYLGFGRLHPNLWISPYDIREKCQNIIERLMIKEYTTIFMTDYIGDDPRLLAFRAWNLDRLSKRYQKLIEKYQRQYHEFINLNCTDSSQWALEALIRLLKLKEELIELGMKDPYLPKELLPAKWVGFRLKKVVLEYLDVLHKKSSSLIKLDFIPK